MKNALKNELLRINPSFTEEELNNGLNLFELQSFAAKDVISKAGKVADSLFYANSSITRCFYTDQNGEEQTLWMKPEKKFIAEYKSFVSGDASQFNLQFYEDTEVLMLKREHLLHLFEYSKNWAIFSTRLTEENHISLIDVFVNLLANDATQNYQYIEYTFPRFIQVAPLKDIASMLQVSQVTLSRIRSGKQLK